MLRSRCCRASGAATRTGEAAPLSGSVVTQSPPGIRGRRLGNLRERLRDFPGFLERLHGEFGAIASYQLPSMNCCAVFDADLIRQVLVDKRASFPKGEIFEVSRRFITQSAVFTSDGEDHERRRRLMAPAFSGEQLAAYAEIMVENARAMQARWRPAIGETIRRARDSSAAGADLTSVLVRARDAEGLSASLADMEIRNEIYVLLLASFDPMAASLAWTIDHVLRQTGVRDRLEEEADRVLDGRPVTVADYGRLSYTWAVFLEASRLTPPSYFCERVASEDCVLGDYLIKKGTVVQPCFSLCHREEEYWPRAAEFRPERWLGGTAGGCPTLVFLSFSHGPRECLGREFATMLGVFVLASIAQRWRLEPLSATPPKADSKQVYIVKGALPAVATERTSPRGGSTLSRARAR